MPFTERLREALAEPLPGRVAQCAAAVELAYGRHQGPPPPNVNFAGVLVLLVPANNSWVIPVTVRNHRLRHHAGQISFPGGRLEDGENAQNAAIREAEEEIGLRADQVEVVGTLSHLHVFASKFHVTPVVAVAENALSYSPNRSEVEQVLELPVDEIRIASDGKSLRHGNVSFRAPAICLGEWDIWGATAMMLAELTAILRNVKKS